MSGALLAACDPVRQQAVDDLGGEVPGVRQGPLHRPGQPCLLCHNGELGNPSRFSIAGTVFKSEDSRVAAVGVTVQITGANAKTPYTTTTNAAGNFFAMPSEFSPVYPLAVSVTSAGVVTKMTSLINGDGSCATCHTDPAGPTSAGHVYTSPDGGVP